MKEIPKRHERSSGRLQSEVRDTYFYSGNFLEMYDFMVFAYYACVTLRAKFFPRAIHRSLMMTLGTCSGCCSMCRLFGRRGPWNVRGPQRAPREGTPVNAFLMAVGTLVIALTPSYARSESSRRSLCCWGDCCRDFRLESDWEAFPFICRRSPHAGHAGFYCAGNRQPAGGGHVRGAAGGGAQVWMPPEIVDAMGMASSLRSAVCLIVPLLFWMRKFAAGNGSFPEAQAPSGGFPNFYFRWPGTGKSSAWECLFRR